MIRTLLGVYLLLTLSAGCAEMGIAPSQATNTGPATNSVTQSESPTVVELPDFPRVAAREQKTDYWCWAASAEMVHLYQKSRVVTQEELAGRILGRAKLGGSGEEIAESAQREEVLAALSPKVWEAVKLRDMRRDDRESKKLNDMSKWRINPVALFVGTPECKYDTKLLSSAISARQPAIVAFDRPTKHVCVVFGLEFVNQQEKGIFGLPIDVCRIITAKYVDPADGKVYTISGEELKQRAGFVATVDSAEQYFRELAEYEKVPFIVPKGAKGKYIEFDTWKAILKAGEIRSKVQSGGRI